MKRFGVFFTALVAALSFAAAPAKALDPALSYAANAAFLKDNAAKPGVVVRPSGLQYNVVQSGAGEHPGRRDTVTVYYRGALINGKVFDGTGAGQPANFPVNRLIPGWTEALLLMRPGDVWHVVIPAKLAYGSQGVGNGLIPPGQVLVFDMQLVSSAPP